MFKYQIIYRNQSKCSNDTNLDRTHYYIDVKSAKAMAKYKWHLSNLVAFIRLNIFVKIDLNTWLDTPFQDPKKPPETSSLYIQGVLF